MSRFEAPARYRDLTVGLIIAMLRANCQQGHFCLTWIASFVQMQTTAANTAIQHAAQEQERANAVAQQIEGHKQAHEKLVETWKQTQTELTTSYQKQKVRREGTAALLGEWLRLNGPFVHCYDSSCSAGAGARSGVWAAPASGSTTRPDV